MLILCIRDGKYDLAKKMTRPVIPVIREELCHVIFLETLPKKNLIGTFYTTAPSAMTEYSTVMGMGDPMDDAK